MKRSNVGPAVPDPRRRLRFLALLVMFGAMATQLWPGGWTRDRWGRKDLETRFPAGGESHHVLLVNSGQWPLYAELRSQDWSGPRCELLLPGDEQWVAIPATAAGGGDMHLRALALDMPAAAHHVFDLPEDECGSIWVTIAEDGQPAVEHSECGDSSPPRNMAVLRTHYALPVRVELPFDAHERPAGSDLERRSWVGPGTDDELAGSSCRLRPGVQLTCAVPPPAEPALRVQGPADADTSTRIVLRWDGTLTRDTIPFSRRLLHSAGL
jgi:hypothetical protein